MVTLERVRAKPEEKSQEVIPAYNFKTTRVISQNIMKIENPKECGETFRVMRDFAQAGLGYAAIFFQEMQKNNVLTPQMSNIFHRDKWIAFYPRNKNLELAT